MSGPKTICSFLLCRFLLLTMEAEGRVQSRKKVPDCVLTPFGRNHLTLNKPYCICILLLLQICFVRCYTLSRTARKSLHLFVRYPIRWIGLVAYLLLHFKLYDCKNMYIYIYLNLLVFCTRKLIAFSS